MYTTVAVYCHPVNRAFFALGQDRYVTRKTAILPVFFFVKVAVGTELMDAHPRCSSVSLELSLEREHEHLRGASLGDRLSGG